MNTNQENNQGQEQEIIAYQITKALFLGEGGGKLNYKGANVHDFLSGCTGIDFGVGSRKVVVKLKRVGKERDFEVKNSTDGMLKIMVNYLYDAGFFIQQVVEDGIVIDDKTFDYSPLEASLGTLYNLALSNRGVNTVASNNQSEFYKMLDSVNTTAGLLKSTFQDGITEHLMSSGGQISMRRYDMSQEDFINFFGNREYELELKTLLKEIF